MLAAISLVAAAACGGDDDDDATEESAPSGTEAITEGTESPDTTTGSTEGTEPAGHRGDRATDTRVDGTADDRRRRRDEFEPGPGETPPRGGRGRAGAGRHARVRPRGRHGQRVGALPGELRDERLRAAERRSATRCSRRREDGEIVPQLVETVEPNDDYTEWTLTIKEGITFHDGTPLDGAAVKFNIDACRLSPLTGGALHADRRRRRPRARPSRSRLQGGPWVVLPAYFTGGSCGYMLSPQWLGSLADVPQRNRGLAGLRRRAGGHAGRRRPGRTGRARRVRVRVLHARQRQRLPRRAQRGLLAGPERHHR